MHIYVQYKNTKNFLHITSSHPPQVIQTITLHHTTHVSPLRRQSNTPFVRDGRAALRRVLRNDDKPPLPLFDPLKEREGGW